LTATLKKVYTKVNLNRCVSGSRLPGEEAPIFKLRREKASKLLAATQTGF
jgi:hypothetical protein